MASSTLTDFCEDLDSMVGGQVEDPDDEEEQETEEEEEDQN